MTDSKFSYQQILKVSSLFGGVQFVTIISSISGLGMETSAVKHISQDFKNDDLNSVSVTVAVVKKIALLTGIVGALLTIVFSNWLSIITFGNSDQMYSFVFLSITLLFRQLSIGQLVVLQGLRKMRLLAKANLYGNIFGLLFSIPLYYYYGIDAIVPTIIVASLSALLFSFYYSKKMRIQKSKATANQLLTDGKSIIRLGLMLSFSGLLTVLSTYLIQIYIGKSGGLEEVGFYNAGFTLLNSYVGIVFTVMSTDYFPRLVSISNENEKVRESVVQQSFISILIITPIIILFLTLIPLIIKIIYTPKFVSVIPMVCFGILAMLFRAVSWSMGYILIAKGDSKMFLKTALGFNSIAILFNVFGYHFYGLEGLGLSFFVYYLIHFFALRIITKKRYGFYFDKDFYQIYLICFLMCLVTFLFRYISNPFLKYGLMSVMVIFSFVFVFYQVNRKMEIRELFNAVIKRKND